MPSPRIHRAARSFAIGAALVSIAIAAVALFGWALGIERWTSFFPGLAPMKPNTALACMMSGAALIARADGRRWAMTLAHLAAGLVITIGAANLSEDLFGWDLGIDQAILQAPDHTSHAAHPGRFAPATALGLVLLGTALLLLDTQWGAGVAQVLAVTASFDGVLALAGYTYDPPSLYMFAPYRSVAFPTGVTITLLGVAVLCARPDRGVAVSLFGTNRGAWMTRRILPAAVIVFLAFGWLKLTGEQRGWFADAIGDGILVTASAAILVISIWMHAALTQRVETALVESEQRLRLATDGAGIGLWFWELESDRVVWTPVCAEIFGVDPERRLSSSEVLSLFHPEDREAVDHALGGVVDDGEHLIDARVTRPDGSTRWVSIRGRVFRDADGRVTRMVGVLIDVTDKKRIEHDRETLLESERAARAALERNIRMKDEFLATISHELRTPLNAVVGWTHILRRQRHADLPGKPLEVIERNARLLEQIISDLLDMSRIVVGKLRFSTRPVDLVPIVDAAVEAIRPAAQAKGLALSCHGVGGTVRGDADRLQQIMWNLLSNAVKFTPRGGHIDVAVDAADTRVSIRVTDTGEGIPTDFLPHVFDHFRQADASKTRKHGGLGLGLALVKQLVELHGGTIGAESLGPGHGATMTMTLPLATTPNEWGGTSPAIPDACPDSHVEPVLPSLRGVKVLVVDDEPDARELLARLLREHDADVRAVACAADALEALACDPPHVLVSDIGMPGMDGYALLQHARARGLDVPAAATTAFVRPEEQVRARDAGYQAHLSKPIQPARLITTVAELAMLGVPQTSTKHVA